MSKSPLKQMKPSYIEHGPEKDKNTTVLGKDAKGTAINAYVNHPLMTPDWNDDKNISGGELAVEAGLSLIGGGIAKNAISKISGKSVKRIGGGISKFFNNYINPASGKKVSGIINK